MSEGVIDKSSIGLEGLKDNDIEFLTDVELKVTLEFGRGEFDIQKLLSWKIGTVVQLDKQEGEALEFRANGNLVAKGEAVVVNEKYGVRITQIVNPQDFELEDV